jgi:3-mercaptopyruvate sulfurtransferase SseA
MVYGLLALLLLAACSGSAGSAPEIVSQDEVPRITPQEVAAQQEAGKRVVIADARSFESYQERHIVGAVSVPVIEVEDHLDELPKRAHIVFYCT